VALALGSAPRAGEPADAEAVQALLAETDDVLAELKALEEGAPQEARAALDALRSRLVGEAVDLTEAVHRLSAHRAGDAAQTPPPLPRPVRAGRARVLSNVSGDRTRGVRAPVRTRWLVVLAVAALAAGAFHVHEASTRPPPPGPPTFAGAPRDAVGVRHRDVGIVVPRAGKTLDPGEVERFKAQEALRGNVVKEIAPGVHVSVPEAARDLRKP
jgi:hypothetical protein